MNFYNAGFCNLVIDDDKIILAGGAYASDISFEENPFICSFDADNGNLLNAKYYKGETSESYIRQLYKCANGYLALDNLFSYDDPSKGKHIYMRFDKDLNLISAKRIKGYSGNTADYTFAFLPEPDGSFYMALGSTFSLAISYFDKDDNAMWIKDIPGFLGTPTDIKQNNDGLFITGASNFTNVPTGGNESYFYLVKSDFNGSLINCKPDEKLKIETSDYVFHPGNFKNTCKRCNSNNRAYINQYYSL